MTTATMERSGGCACGALRFIARGDASRVGLCHCLVCQRAHGAPYLAFAVFARAAVALCGPYAAWESSPGYYRLHCPTCGSRFVNLAGDEIELPVASFDDATGLVPQYENWITRRLPWVAPLPVPQFARNRES
ncbi:GFA family protein [Sphingobium fuliginis]|uniref:GFA family protein n=2 Tax=Sphingobium fuliginis (strain ATCC 27551) TaxID=336203 RepID=A0A4Q4J0Q3_SPHSA|nr:GFA family protein [Sphingobium fuliginis]RYL99578.1 GFA family protein [Sphingobium fuliginis]